MGHLQQDLIGLSSYTFGRTRERLADLTDDELLWEPADWCWSVRRVGDVWQADGSAFPPTRPVFTTIAWRLDHLIDVYGETRNPRWLAAPVPDDMRGPTGTAEGELARLDEAFDRWKAVLDATDEESLATKLGPIGEQYAEATRAAFALHMIDEAIHHGAEIGVLRDLYRARAIEPPAMDTVADAAANSCWARVAELAASGADVNGGGMTPLHLAVAAGAKPTVEALLAAGADTAAKDPQYDSTPKQWAEFFHRDEIAALLS